MAKITAAVAAASIAAHFVPSGPAQVSALNTAVAAIVKSATLAGTQDGVQIVATAVSKAPTVTLTAAQLATELGKFADQLLALKRPVSPAECMTFNASIAAYSAALQS